MPAAIASLLHALDYFDSEIDMAAIVQRYNLTLTSIETYAARSAAATRL